MTPETEERRHLDLSRRALLARLARIGVTSLLAGPALMLAAAPNRAEAAARFDLLGKPSVDQQKQLGHQAADQILHKYHEVFDRRADLFRRVGDKLVAALPHDDQKWDFTFHVLESKEINAFALPGGPMFMFTGLYERMNTVDAVAAVTGHEMTHVRKEHWAKAYQKEQQRRLGLSILLGVAHAGELTQVAAGLANNLVGLKYSRSEEDEADAGGLEDLVAAGYNPQGMIDLFDTLQKIAGNGGGLGGALLADHPLTSDRIKHTRQRIADLGGDRKFPPLTPLDYKSLLPTGREAPPPPPRQQDSSLPVIPPLPPLPPPPG